MKLDLNRVLELPGEADVVTADVDLTTVKHAGRPLFTEPVKATAKAMNRAGGYTRLHLPVYAEGTVRPLPGPIGAAGGAYREPHRGAERERRGR